MQAETHILPGAIITFKSRKTMPDLKEVAVNHKNISDKIIEWGDRNELPQHREAMIMDNNIIGELLNTKRSIILGSGLGCFDQNDERVDMPEEIDAWMKAIDIYDSYLEEATNQLMIHANIFAAIIPGAIPQLTAYKCRDTRAVLRILGKPITKYIVGTWNEKKFDRIYYVTIPAATDTMLRDVKKLPKVEFIQHVGDKLIYDNYYYHPSYWGGEEWIDLANEIPKFHKANLKNGVSIRFHIQIPSDAFLDKSAYDLARASDNPADLDKCKSEEQSKKQSFIDQVNNILSGAENAGRALYTFFQTDDLGKSLDGVKIEPIKFDMQDDALIKLYEKSNQAIISSSGIHPVLANIETQGKLSSGSEIRNAYEFYAKIKARVPRMIILKPINTIWKMMGWDQKYKGLKLGFLDIELTTLDENPTGTQPAQNEVPDQNSI